MSINQFLITYTKNNNFLSCFFVPAAPPFFSVPYTFSMDDALPGAADCCCWAWIWLSERISWKADLRRENTTKTLWVLKILENKSWPVLFTLKKIFFTQTGFIYQKKFFLLKLSSHFCPKMCHFAHQMRWNSWHSSTHSTPFAGCGPRQIGSPINASRTRFSTCKNLNKQNSPFFRKFLLLFWPELNGVIYLNINI